MKLLQKFFAIALIAMAIFGSTSVAWAQTQGVIEERWGTYTASQYYGGGNIYTYSKANVGSVSLTVQDYSVSTSISSAEITGNAVSAATNLRVKFTGYYEVPRYPYLHYTIYHQY